LINQRVGVTTGSLFDLILHNTIHVNGTLDGPQDPAGFA